MNAAGRSGAAAPDNVATRRDVGREHLVVEQQVATPNGEDVREGGLVAFAVARLADQRNLWKRRRQCGTREHASCRGGFVEPLALDLSAAFFVHGAVGRRRRHDPAVGLAEDRDAVSRVRRRMSSTASRKKARYSSGASETSEISGIPVTTEPGKGPVRSHPRHRVRVDDGALRESRGAGRPGAHCSRIGGRRHVCAELSARGTPPRWRGARFRPASRSEIADPSRRELFWASPRKLVVGALARSAQRARHARRALVARHARRTLRRRSPCGTSSPNSCPPRRASSILFLLKLPESFAHFSLSYVLVPTSPRSLGTRPVGGLGVRLLRDAHLDYGVLVGFLIDRSARLAPMLGSFLLLGGRLASR